MIDDIAGIGFERADRIAAHIGVDRQSDYRIDMGIKHVLVTAMNDGHTCLPRGELLRRATATLGVEEALVDGRLSALTLADQLAVHQPHACRVPHGVRDRIRRRRRLYLLPAARRVLLRPCAPTALYRRYAAVRGTGAGGIAASRSGGHQWRAGTGKDHHLKTIISIFGKTASPLRCARPPGGRPRIEHPPPRSSTIHRL